MLFSELQFQPAYRECSDHEHYFEGWVTQLVCLSEFAVVLGVESPAGSSGCDEWCFDTFDPQTTREYGSLCFPALPCLHS